MSQALTRRTAAALPLAALLGPAAAAVSTTATTADPVFAQIAGHRSLLASLAHMPGLDDDDPVYMTACDNEEAALQALGDVVPTTVAGAAALLAYMAEREADFADAGSPLLRTVLTVARGLQQMTRASA